MLDAFETDWEVVFDRSKGVPRSTAILVLDCKLVGTFNPNDAPGPTISEAWVNIALQRDPNRMVDLLAEKPGSDLHLLGLAIAKNVAGDRQLIEHLSEGRWHGQPDQTGYVGEFVRVPA